VELLIITTYFLTYRYFVLRFIIEDSALHLCDRSVNDACDFDEFVRVLDMGTFELSLKFSSGQDKKQPLMDLSMTNNMLNVRTCADSCIALMKLIQYFASDGDLQTGISSEFERDLNVNSSLYYIYIYLYMYNVL